MTEAVALRDTTAILSREKRTPDEIIAEGQSQAKALMRIVRDANLAKNLGGSKDHLEVEAWVTILKFNGYVPKITCTKTITGANGDILGYTAHAEAQNVYTGELFSGADADCWFEEVIETKDGREVTRWTDHYACKSMAQTRAVSKLGRVAFSWVAVLAGYSGTPAEEMDGVRRNAAGRPVVFPFGKHKDQQPSALPLEDLHTERAFWEKKTAEETNPKFKANNERLVSAIQDAIAEKLAKPETTEQSTEVPESHTMSQVKAEGTDSNPATSMYLSDLEKAWVEARELMEAAGWTEAKLTVWARKTKGIGPKELDLLGVQALCAHLRSLGQS